MQSNLIQNASVFPCIVVARDFGTYLKLVEIKNKSFSDLSVFVLF